MVHLIDGRAAQTGEQQKAEEAPEGEAEGGGEEFRDVGDAGVGQVGAEPEAAEVEHNGQGEAQAARGEGGLPARGEEFCGRGRQDACPESGQHDAFAAREAREASGEAGIHTAEELNPVTDFALETSEEAGQEVLPFDEQEHPKGQHEQSAWAAGKTACRKDRDRGDPQNGGLGERSAQILGSPDVEQQALARVVAGQPVSADVVQGDMEDGITRHNVGESQSLREEGGRPVTKEEVGPRVHESQAGEANYQTNSADA